MYWAIARSAFQRQLSYRAANLAGLATNAFFGALRAYVLLALFGARPLVEGYSVRDAVTFTGLTQALLSFVALFPWFDVLRTIRTGEVATDLARPVDFYGYWWAQDAGRALAQVLLRGLPILLLYALLFDLVLPARLEQWLALPVSLALALSISFSWRFLYSLTAFWTQDAIGLARLGSMVATFFSGFLMPLAFFPDWLRTGMRFTPFPGMIYTPVEIYLGQVSGAALWAALATQLMWAGALYGLARVTAGLAVRKLVIQGG
jgi:ABC-2 type transport system permease protein